MLPVTGSDSVRTAQLFVGLPYLRAGRSGVAFDWSILNRYDNEKPFFISGGIGLDNIDQIDALKGMKLYGVDVKSQVEIEPGLKDVAKVKELLDRLRPIEEEAL